MLALFVAAGCARSQLATTQRLALAGAQIPLELVESWLRESKNPAFKVERVQPVYLSQHGFEHLAGGTADIACADRQLSKLERKERFADGRVQGFRIGFYGYALYVNPANKLDSIFAGHLGLLFQRKIRDWSELAAGQTPGLEGPIRLIGPEKRTRGGEVLMRQAKIWFDRPTWEPRETDAEIIDAVAADPLALGFASVGYDQGVRYLGLRMERGAEPVFPSLEQIENETYGLAKVIYLYVRTPVSPAVQAALDYLHNPEGRRAIESTNVWPVSQDRSRVAEDR
ncbi:MAG: substrate-binding domain-containing protein [Phycisphaerae bacterium]